MIFTAATAFASKFCLDVVHLLFLILSWQFFFIFRARFNLLKEFNSLVVGVVSDPYAPSSFGAWITYAGTRHTGAVSFFLMDFFLFFGVAVLTVVQGSQVSR